MTNFRAGSCLSCALLLLPFSTIVGGVPDCCRQPLNYHFSLSRISDHFLPDANSPRTTAQLPELGTNCLGDQLTHEVSVPTAGDDATVGIYLNVISEDLDRLFPDPADADLRGRGVQGWSAGIAVDNVQFADVDGDTVRDGFIAQDTAADVNPLWGGTGFAGGSGPSGTKLAPSFFFFWEIIDPSVNAGQNGSVVGFVHCLDGCDATEFGELPLDGTESLLRIVVDVGGAGVPIGGVQGAVRIQQGLRVSELSIPSDAVFTISSRSFAACNRDHARMGLSFVIDCNANEMADSDDVADGTSADCNTNGVPDECEIAAGTVDDMNANGVPDQCDPDCNSNQVPDDLDISGGTSQDCDANGVPDECDIDAGTHQDCNANGVPDVCDISSGVSRDCNSNDDPDECDIANGSSDDADGNGIPDECPGLQVPGDWNGDGGFNLADAIRLLNLLFQGQTDFPCEIDDVAAMGNRTALDFNGDDRVNLADAVAALNRLFLAGDPHVLGGENDCVPIAGCADVCAP